ncbi:hypothetical protein A9Q99_26675 [Gammaproteobacteria bacterium 45_16_T64]|nr:hypothetical protein A9Q99_26675 [Gammaproteobacteria bacterium 45_16_T64]
MTTASALLDRFFHIASQSIPSDMSFVEWKAKFDLEKTPWCNTVDRALLAGAISDRVAYAFSGGYQSALNALFPSSFDNKLSAFCVTEEGGNHPKAIQTTLIHTSGQWFLNGSKKFITGGCDADRLFVAANQNIDTSQKPSIVMVEIYTSQSGIAITPMPTLPFVPEVTHGTATFDNVHINEGSICPGDGYDEYIKPFRTIEDIHISAALLGYICSTAIRLSWNQNFIERSLACILMHRELATMDAKSPSTHLVLAGVQQTAVELFQQAEPMWATTDPGAYSLWKRDKSILGIASAAQLKRKEKAWSTLLSVSQDA